MNPPEWPDPKFGDVIIFRRMSSEPVFTVGIVLVDGDLTGTTHDVVNSQTVAERIAFSLVTAGGRVFLRSGVEWRLVAPPPDQQ